MCRRATSQRRKPATLIALAGSTGALLFIIGCSKNMAPPGPHASEPPPRALRAPPGWDASARPVTAPLTPPRDMGQSETALIATQRLGEAPAFEGVAPGAIEPTQGELIRVQGSWNQVDVRELLHVLLDEYLERDYMLDPALQGQITLEIDEEMTRADLMDLIGGIASIFNWTFEERGDVLLVRPGVAAARLPGAPVLLANPAVAGELAAVRVRRLRYISADQLTTLLESFASDGATIVHWGRMLVMADTTRQLARLSQLVAALDVAPFQGAEIWTYQLASRAPEEAAQVLQSLIPASGLTRGADPLAVAIALPGTDRLIIVARDASVQPVVGDMLREIDRPTYGEARRRYIYRVQHFPVADLYNLIRASFADRLAPLQGTPNTSVEALMDIQISTNSDILLIHATPTDYAELIGVLREVDRPPMQVHIQSIIAEVRLSNRLEFGVEYFLTLGLDSSDLELIGLAPLTGVPTGSAFLVGSDGFALIQALDAESEARVISQPRLVLQDHATSSIQVGGEVPVLRASEGSETQAGGTSAIREEIEYRETGVILTIQAEINESGLVTLHITQEVRDALPTDIANQPEFTTRTIETVVTVPHGQTVLLGGIISSNDITEKSHIPILGRIPVLGAIFSQTLDRVERTELVLAITPTIIADPQQGHGLLSEFLRSAQGVRAALHSQLDSLPQGALHGATPDPLVPIGESPPAPSDQDSLDPDQTDPSRSTATKSTHHSTGGGLTDLAPFGTLSLNPFAALGSPSELSGFALRPITAPTSRPTAHRWRSGPEDQVAKTERSAGDDAP